MSHSKKSRIVTLLLAVIMTLGVCTGGLAESVSKAVGDPNIDLSGALPIVKDPSEFPHLKILVLVSSNRTRPISELAQVQRFQEETGVIFDWIEIPYTGAAEKISLMIAGNDLPDAFWNGIDNSMVVQYMDQDVFLPTEDLIDQYVPRLKEIYETRLNYKAEATMPNGHMYGFPYIEEMYGLINTPGPFMINTDWLTQVGKDMPTTVDEWVDCLKAFRDAGDLNGNGLDDEFPYAVGLGLKDFLGTVNTFLQFTGCFGRASTTNLGFATDYFGVDGEEIVFTANDPGYKDTAIFFNMLNNENLIDPNSFSPGIDEETPLYINTVKDNVAHIGSFAVWEPRWYLPVKEVHDQYAPLPRLEGPVGKMGHKANFSEMQYTSKLAITTACEYPEVLAAFANYMYDPEISITTNWGALGVMYRKDENGKLVNDVDENGELILKEGFVDIENMESNNSPGSGPICVLDEYYDGICDYANNAIELLEFQKVNGKDEIVAEYTSVPMLLLTVEEQNIVSQIQPQIYAIVTRYTMQWILDGQVEETWQTYLNDLQAAGLQELTDILQNAYNRYLGSL